LFPDVYCFCNRTVTISAYGYLPLAAVSRGENWDYLVQPEGSSLRLRASAPPMDRHETGASVWLQIDPTRAARIPPP